MSFVETEFEEDSFEDEFEPESEREIERRCPKPKPMPLRGQARHLAAMLQKGLSVTQERTPSSTADDKAVAPLASDSDTSAGLSSPASANRSSAKRTTNGGASSAEFVSALRSPRSLKQLTASSLLQQTAKERIQKFEAPSHLYPVLLSEASRLRYEDAIVHLVSTWRLSVLNLSDIDIPLEEFLTRFPDDTGPCIADLIIKGLLYRRQKFCQLQMIVLPKDSRIGSDILGHFARIPFHYCSRLRQMRLPQYLAAGRMKEGPKYLKEVPKITTKHEINFYAYMKGNVKVTIAVPIGVVHWIGRKANLGDVHVGLILQKYSPFVFHFENIAFINFVDSEAAGVMLGLIVNPEKVKKIFLKNKRVFRPDHLTYTITSLSATLRRFTGLRGFFTKLNSMIGFGPEDDYQLKDDDPENIAAVIRSWPQLTRLNLNDQPLDLPGAIPAIINPIMSGLTKLSLVRCKMSADDVKVLSASQHVNTLQLLRLDYNDFKECVDDICDLLSRLKAIQILRMQACHIKYRSCMRCAEALAHSRTLRIWNFTDNVLFKLRHIKEFVELCSNIVSLRAVGCRPLDYHVLLGKVAVPTNRGLSENKKRELDEFGESLNLIIF